jgi:hypothetical protein
MSRLTHYDKGSLTVCSMTRDINRAMMGGDPPDVAAVLAVLPDLKVNVVLGPENFADVPYTLRRLYQLGIRRVNLREPFGQRHVGNPIGGRQYHDTLGMHTYEWDRGMFVTYWDVHWVQVRSVNLYADGSVSEQYVVADDNRPQSTFGVGRQIDQWRHAGHPA